MKRRMTLRILETDPKRTVTLDGLRIGGPGGDGRVVAELTVERAALAEALRDDARQGELI